MIASFIHAYDVPADPHLKRGDLASVIAAGLRLELLHASPHVNAIELKKTGDGAWRVTFESELSPSEWRAWLVEQAKSAHENAAQFRACVAKCEENTQFFEWLLRKGSSRIGVGPTLEGDAKAEV
ncbi:MAG: hypothetical protein HYV09_18065 [Deltaproteobacteria bacterium]|nr:hypothetical protein [Deltaproteobacteria bacterium]